MGDFSTPNVTWDVNGSGPLGLQIIQQRSHLHSTQTRIKLVLITAARPRPGISLYGF